MRFMRYYVLAFSLFVKEPTFRALGLAALMVLLIGTVFYHFNENWSWLDSLYFTTVTLASVGYGDFVPTSELSRLFTVVYIVLGFGIIAGFLSTLVRAPLLMQEHHQIPSVPAQVADPLLPKRHLSRHRTPRRARRPRYSVTRSVDT
jgi:hypothetical protein